ncbi:MAG: hypothetical protein CME88_11500 [Hirschia sp.]|nr:hypothetical protein [Hirschia sp.]MBF18995.1 hypothetical protein [Hirschia sp.]|tara:strand:+ start:2654 stop:3901 length:1248 start_codon:yes stop_codon:yes gene_type:complete
MPSRIKSEPTALQTGLKHAAFAIGGFGTIAALVVGVVMLTGDANVGSSRAEINLFADRPGASPILKARLNDSAGTAQAHTVSHSDEDGHDDEPQLDVQSADDTGENVRILTAAKPDENGAVRINVSEQLANQPPQDEAEPERRPLAPAPITGFYERGPVGRLPMIASDGRTPAQIYARPHAATEKPKISLIVGGLGLKYSLTMQAIRDLPPEVTLSFVPYSNNLQTYVNAARKAGHEVLLEIPMEPYDYPNVDTGPETLLTSVTAEENERRLRILMGKTTGYFGVINYQGAKLATDGRTLDPIMTEIKDRGLAFFYDGGAPRAVFDSVAMDQRLDFAEADRIVDARPTSEAIDRNLLHLEALALQNGHALGVGFAYPVTVDQFHEWAKTLDYRGYELVPASMAAGVEPIDPNTPS